MSVVGRLSKTITLQHKNQTFIEHDYLYQNSNIENSILLLNVFPQKNICVHTCMYVVGSEGSFESPNNLSRSRNVIKIVFLF